MANTAHDEGERGPTWRYIAIGACALVMSVGGLAIGLWAESLDKRAEVLDQKLGDIRATQQAQWRILEERASLAPRTADLEKRADDWEQRIRALERQSYRNGWK